MKEFKIISCKECPQCGFIVKSEMNYAYDNNWCPHCGYGYKEAIQKDSAYKDNKNIEYNSGYDDAVRSGLL